MSEDSQNRAPFWIIIVLLVGGMVLSGLVALVITGGEPSKKFVSGFIVIGLAGTIAAAFPRVFDLDMEERNE